MVKRGKGESKRAQAGVPAPLNAKIKRAGETPAVRKATANVEHLGANGTEGPFLALRVGARLRHPVSELDLEPVKCLD